jgi:hypothetical protein
MLDKYIQLVNSLVLTHSVYVELRIHLSYINFSGAKEEATCSTVLRIHTSNHTVEDESISGTKEK